MFQNPLLLVCLAIGLGALLGRLAVYRVSLGVAGVLFAGVICGWLQPGTHPPDALATFGLALFVYSIGLSSSEALFDTWANGGWKFGSSCRRYGFGNATRSCDRYKIIRRVV